MPEPQGGEKNAAPGPPVEPKDRRDVPVKTRMVPEVDMQAVVSAAAPQVDAYIAEREAAGKPVPDRQELLDRVAHVARAINPQAPPGSVNSPERNQKIVIVHREAPPFFGVTTEGEA